MLFASILNLSVMLGYCLQQTISADDIFRCIFFLALIGLIGNSIQLFQKSLNGASSDGPVPSKSRSFFKSVKEKINRGKKFYYRENPILLLYLLYWWLNFEHSFMSSNQM